VRVVGVLWLAVAMVADCEVRLGRCMRGGFGYTTLSEIAVEMKKDELE